MDLFSEIRRLALIAARLQNSGKFVPPYLHNRIVRLVAEATNR